MTIARFLLVTLIPISETSDAPPRPQVVEIKPDDVRTTIGDPDLAAALSELSCQQLRMVLHESLRASTEQPEIEMGS